MKKLLFDEEKEYMKSFPSNISNKTIFNYIRNDLGCDELFYEVCKGLGYDYKNDSNLKLKVEQKKYGNYFLVCYKAWDPKIEKALKSNPFIPFGMEPVYSDAPEQTYTFYLLDER